MRHGAHTRGQREFLKFNFIYLLKKINSSSRAGLRFLAKIKIPRQIKVLEAFETMFAVISILFMTKGFELILPDLLVTVLRYGILLTSFGFILLKLDRSLYIASRGWFTATVSVLNIASFLWSDFPDETFLGIRSEMLPMTIFGLYLATRFSLRRQVELISYALLLAIFLSLAVAIISPSIGISTDGSLRGIFVHRNLASSYGMLSSLAFFSLSLDKSKSSFLSKAMFGLSCFFVLLTNSKTGLVLVVFIPLSLAIYRRLKFQGRFAAAILFWVTVSVGIFVAFVISNWNFLLDTIGGDPTLTGRTPMWTFMLEEVNNRPWLGFGRTAFWAPQTYNSIRVAQTVTPIGYTVKHAHNGYIELLLDVGWVGATFFIFSFIKTCNHALRNAYLATKPEEVWALGFLIFLAINNVTESLLTRDLNLVWVLFVSLSFSLFRNKRFENHH